MTIKEYLNNPNEKKIPGYNLVKDELRSRYNKMIKEGKKFIIRSYVADTKGLFVLVKVPTESEVPKLYYDVLLSIDSGGNLQDCDFKVYSNCPSFTYRYAYVFNKNNMIVPNFIKYYDKEVLNKEPEITNPIEIIGYEKSILFALWALEDNGYRTYGDLRDDILMDRSELRTIMDAESKKQQAQVMNKKYKKDNKDKPKKVVDVGTRVSTINTNIKTTGNKITAQGSKAKIGSKKKIGPKKKR